MSLFPKALRTDAEVLLQACRDAGLHIATAESCTGGLIAACLSEIPGASDVLDRGLVTYSNAAKTELLGVPPEMIRAHGAVSAAVAEAMAAGALAHTQVDVAVSATGIAGPGGGSSEKPVGLVFVGAARRGRSPVHERHTFPGDRSAVRMATVAAAIALVRRMLA